MTRIKETDAPSPDGSETVFFRCDKKPSEGRGYIRIPGRLFPQGRRYIETEEAPDIISIVEQTGPLRIYCAWRDIVRARRRYGFRPALFHFVSEPGNPRLPVDLKLSAASPSNRQRDCTANIAFILIFERRARICAPPGSTHQNERRKQLLETAKIRFCNFIYTDDRRPQTAVRRNFCRLLAQYKRVDCPAGSLNNMPRIGGTPQSKLDFMAGCKFSITFENTSQEYYLTEKLGDALHVGSIPIYWGDPRAAEYFNPEAFINCHDYDSFDRVVQRVIEVDNDPQLYEAYRKAPPILPDSGFYRMERETKERCAFIVQEALRRRSIKRKPLWDALRLCAMILRYLPVEIKGRAILAYERLHKKFPWIKSFREAFRRMRSRSLRRAIFR